MKLIDQVNQTSHLNSPFLVQYLGVSVEKKEERPVVKAKEEVKK